jgi:hypothetical protein
VDGLLLKIAYDFLNLMERRGLATSNIRIKFLPREKSLGFSVYKNSENFIGFKESYGPIIFDRRFLCSSGDFPVIENIILTNKNLNFENQYFWYNITDQRKLTKKIRYDEQRKDIYEREIKRYLDLMYKEFDIYTKNVNNAIKERLNKYVDPCYVDAGYISPN